MKDNRISGVRVVSLGVVLAAMFLLPAGVLGQQLFDSPQAALDALTAAIDAHDREALQRIFGPQTEDLKSGDPVQDAADAKAFAARLKSAARLEQDGDAKVTLLVGPEEHPFAVPIVSKEGKWFFDTAAGKEEMLNRRIGKNELGAIRVCRAYVAGQQEFYLSGAAGTGVPEYAQRLMSTPGKHDGLCWDTKPDEPPSPLGPLVGQAQAEGYGNRKSGKGEQPRPYHGYVYKILTRQGKMAPGGKYDYVNNDHMVAGFAMVAYPVQYNSSGIMTLLVGPGGKVYQKDLGEKTVELAQKMREYEPDDSWSLVQD
jgi:hypothetical protein